MIRLSIGLGLLVCAAPALAQAPPPPPPATAPVSAWPEEISLRPPTLTTGLLELHGSLPIFAIDVDSDALVLGGVGAAYGISDELELGGDYAFLVSPEFDAAGVIAGHVLYRLQHDDKLSMALGGAVLYSHDQDGIVIAGGLSLRYRLNKQLSLYSNTSGMPICGSCLQILGPVSGQLVVAIPNNGDTAAILNLPVGIAYQASPQLYLFGETSLGTILITPNTDSILEFADYVGIHIGGWFAASKDLELGVGFADELQHLSDVYLLELRAKIFLH